jgi:hypothetical protein
MAFHLRRTCTILRGRPIKITCTTRRRFRVAQCCISYIKNNPKIIENWKNLQPMTVKLMQFYNETVGKYPYEQYSVIQGGDGGMEYAMCTLILGEGTFEGLSA